MSASCRGGVASEFAGDAGALVGRPPDGDRWSVSRDKELIAGLWLWQVKSMEEAVEWVRRMPNPMPGTEPEIEIEAEEFTM